MVTIPVKSLFGVQFSDLSRKQLLDVIDDFVQRGVGGYVVTPNVDHCCLIDTEPEFRSAYERARLVLVDGTPVLWAAHLLGQALKEKLSGSDLIHWVSELAAKRGYRVYLLGSTEETLRHARAKLMKTYPGINIVGMASPVVSLPDFDAQQGEQILSEIAAVQTQICFVGLGTPKQELWCHHFVGETAPLFLCIGAAMDFVSGSQRRAPRLMQRAGLEWFWRLAHNPRRFWKRYLVRDSRFVLLFLRELFRSA